MCFFTLLKIHRSSLLYTSLKQNTMWTSTIIYYKYNRYQILSTLAFYNNYFVSLKMSITVWREYPSGYFLTVISTANFPFSMMFVSTVANNVIISYLVRIVIKATLMFQWWKTYVNSLSRSNSILLFQDFKMRV